MTRSEQRLWMALRGKQLGGVKFRRQHVLGPYVVDFFCSARRLAIEIDGGVHLDD
jgi:very-short-patch-repair endonuclease